MLDPVAGKIGRYMDLLSTRQKLVSSNIANIDTPGYKTKDIDFESELSSQSADAPPTVVETPGLLVNNDGNNVNLDHESRMLAENAMRFNVASSLMRYEIQITRMAIEEGRAS